MILAVSSYHSSMNSLGSKVAATIVIGLGWLVFVLLFFTLYGGRFDLWQNVALFLASALIALGVIAVMWIKWILR